MLPIKGYLFKNKKNITFVALIIISFTMMFISNQSAIITLKKVGFSIIYPFQYTINSFGSFFQNTFNSISQLKEMSEELIKTRNELDQYKKIIIDFNDLTTQNRILRKLLNLKEDISYESIACEIVGRDPQKLFDVLIINKGFNDGIKENMPVISYAGGKRILVGKVVETTPFSSKMISLTNPKFSAGSLIVSTKVHTMIQGDNKTPGLIKLLYIPKDYKLSDYEIEFINTSGDSLIFPRGIEIGKIVNVHPSQRYEMFNEGEVEISVDLSKINYVLALKIDNKKEIEIY